MSLVLCFKDFYVFIFNLIGLFAPVFPVALGTRWNSKFKHIIIFKVIITNIINISYKVIITIVKIIVFVESILLYVPISSLLLVLFLLIHLLLLFLISTAAIKF
jgi:hypothetical protein